MAKTIRGEVILLLKMAYDKMNDSNDPIFNQVKPLVKTSVSKIDSKATIGMQTKGNGSRNVQSRGRNTTPPNIKGFGQGKRTTPPVVTTREGENSEDVNSKVPKVKQKRTTTPPSIKGRVTAPKDKEPVEDDPKDETPENETQGTQEATNTENGTDTPNEDQNAPEDAPEDDKGLKIELTEDQKVKIESHPDGGLMGKLAGMSSDEIAQAYNPAQLKSIGEQMGINFHPSIKKGETFAVKILEHIKSTFNEGDKAENS